MKSFARAALTWVSLAAGGLAGYVAGTVRTGLRLRDSMIDANVMSLARGLHELSHLRAGQVGPCISELEMGLDGAVLMASLPGTDRDGRFTAAKLPAEHHAALRQARAYMDAGHAAAFSPRARELLSRVEPAELQTCPLPGDAAVPLGPSAEPAGER